MAYGNFKDSEKRTASDKVLRDKEFNIAKNFKYDRYQRGQASVVYKLIGKKYAGSGVNTHANNEKLAEELHKPIVKKIRKRTVYSGLKNNICGADLPDKQV